MREREREREGERERERVSDEYMNLRCIEAVNQTPIFAKKKIIYYFMLNVFSP